MTDPTTFTSSSDSHGRLRGKRPLAFSAAGKGQQTDRDIGGLRRFIQPTGQEDEIEGECGLMGEEGWDEDTTEEREGRVWLREPVSSPTGLGPAIASSGLV
ncbi:hypothetical protein ASPBRDRAFT_87570, partial [Aspergillus brasiliensis CBS 101740]